MKAAKKKNKLDKKDLNKKDIRKLLESDCFDHRVWKLCIMIPKGRVSTYKIIAEKLGTKAYRAVGQALHRNPYAPVVPCHRVINSDGSTGGFAQGQKRKIELLKKEGVRIKKNAAVNFQGILFKFRS